ncbi:hypothetical protein JXL21_13690 [Candidatus Bathyarchaeota archaeon]|nr:hypothetical protein [Candidatus Bathyarchaeota archaeon]
MGFLAEPESRLTAAIAVLLLAVIAYSCPHLVNPPPVRRQVTPETWGQPVPEYTYPDYGTTEWSPAYGTVVTHEGDLVLSGDETLVIENCTYILDGALVVRDNSRLIVRDAQLYVAEKTSWHYLFDVVPVSYTVAFLNHSSLTVTNSTIVSDRLVTTGMFDHSTAQIEGSDLSDAFIVCKGRSTTTIRDSKMSRVGVIQGAECSITDSNVTDLGPYTASVTEWQRITGGRVTVSGSRVGHLQLVFNHSRDVELTEPLPVHHKLFTAEALGGECDALWATVIDSDVDRLSLYAYDSDVTLANQRLHNVVVTGSLEMADSRCFGLYIGEGAFEVSGCVFNRFSPHTDTEFTLRDSKAKTLHLHMFTGIGVFEQVCAETLDGHETVATVKGSLTLLNETDTGFWGRTRLERVYTVVVEDDGHAVQGAELTLLNQDGDATWRGSTDFFGEARFSLTFYTYWAGARSYRYINNITATRTLVAEKGGLKLNTTVRLGTSTPITMSRP